MRKTIILFFSLFFPISASAHVCNTISNIEGFDYLRLFNNAIMNTKPIDYYIFSSKCKKNCIYKNLNNKNLRHSTINNNISVFDSNSVATIIIDSSDENMISGYLTCSSNNKRSYISFPIRMNDRKVTLDLQTEDQKNITRIINFHGYKKKEYFLLIKELEGKATTKNKIVGFTDYSSIYKRKRYSIKISNLSGSGDFILIIEKLK